MEGSDNVGYGEYAVGGVGSKDDPWINQLQMSFLAIDGLSNLKCLCDPTEATLNDHVPEPPGNLFYFSVIYIFMFFFQKTRNASNITNSMRKRSNASVRASIS